MSEHLKVKVFSASALCGVALLAVVAPLQAQATHAQWLPWVGCWTPVGQGEDAPLLCVTPGEDPASVEFVTITEAEVVSREVARADGQPADDDQEGCEGTTTWTFSSDGHRAYHRSEHVCDGEVGRVATGMMAMASRTEWMDLSSVEVAGQTTPWAQRYRLADRETAEAAGFGDLEGGPRDGHPGSTPERQRPPHGGRRHRSCQRGSRGDRRGVARRAGPALQPGR